MERVRFAHMGSAPRTFVRSMPGKGNPDKLCADSRVSLLLALDLQVCVQVLGGNLWKNGKTQSSIEAPANVPLSVCEGRGDLSRAPELASARNDV